MKDEKLSPEEEERRIIRRERNKLAVARCRKRRMELTSNLMNETDGLWKKSDKISRMKSNSLLFKKRNWNSS
ncbi:hypothetical protein TNIN_315551 [Trichonephila inaurata madagascariensis]|uniref:BZIP domain-containing protein n=1 Tax=Trichonephila inaurata madagascariensis TaxID=2747483 RepID=A0A8X6Y842_9ARAC|nr:hypothetical protein TNIN_315551 [Trichonephila inaurata madagascariensis]